MLLLTENSYFASFSVKAMLLIIDCKKKLTWKKMDHVNGAVISVDGKVASEEKELLKAAESGEVTDKVMEDGVDDLLVSIDKIMAFVTNPLHGISLPDGVLLLVGSIEIWYWVCLNLEGEVWF